MNKKGFAPIILLVIIGVLAIAGGAYYFGTKSAPATQPVQNNNTTGVLPEVVIPSPIINPSPEKSATADLNTLLIDLKKRDSRRVSDLRSVQTALELYYSKNGAYPSTSDWDRLTIMLVSANLGFSEIPKDPLAPAKTYYYSPDANGANYVLGAKLEDVNAYVLRSSLNADSIPKGIKLNGITCSSALGEYCLSL